MIPSERLSSVCLLLFLVMIADHRLSGAPLSTNSVSYNVPSGISLIANPFHQGGNTLAELLPSPPEGTLLYKFDNQQQRFIINQFQFGVWSNPAQTLAPTEGALIRNPTNAFNLVFSGLIAETNTFARIGSGFNLISLPVPNESSLGPLQDGDAIFRLISGQYEINFYDEISGDWLKPFAIGPGEAFFYRRGNVGPSPMASVYLNNYVPADGLNSPVRIFLGGSGLFLPSSNWRAQLYAGLNGPNSLVAVGDPVAFLDAPNAGYFDPKDSVRYVPGSVAGGQLTLQVRFWDGFYGSSLGEAMSRGSPLGQSSTWNINTAPGTYPPSPPTNMIGFDGTFILVGSPSVVAGTLGTQVLNSFMGTGFSQWFRLRSEVDGTMVINTEGSDRDATVAVYIGNDLSTLQLIASQSFSTGNVTHTELRFEARSGSEYLIAPEVINSLEGSVKINWGILPRLTVQPATQLVRRGEPVTLRAEAAGGAPLSYRWQFAGANVTGATNNTLTLTNFGMHLEGDYRFIASNLVGSVTSQVARLAVASASLGDWRMRDSGSTNKLFDVAWGNGQFVAIGAAGTILRSTNGWTWNRSPAGMLTNLTRIIYAQDRFVSVGEMGSVLVSTNGRDWGVQNVGTNLALSGISFANNLFTVVGEEAVLYSRDLITWLRAPLPLRVTNDMFSSTRSYQLRDIAFGSPEFVTVGTVSYNSITAPAGYAILASTDAVDWTDQSQLGIGGLRSYPMLRRICYGAEKFVAVGEEYISGGGFANPILRSEILVSTNGLYWERSPFVWQRSGFVASNAFLGVAHGNGVFVAVGDAGTIVSSPGGLDWTDRSSGISNSLFGVAYGDGSFVAVGNNGIILQASARVPPEPIRLGFFSRPIGGSIHLMVIAAAEQRTIFQASSDLVTWLPVFTNEGAFEFVAPEVTNHEKRFYRAQND